MAINHEKLNEKKKVSSRAGGTTRLNSAKEKWADDFLFDKEDETLAPRYLRILHAQIDGEEVI